MEWQAIVQRLRTVQHACEAFVDLWVVSRLADETHKMDRLAADVERSGELNEAPHGHAGLRRFSGE